ncbi:unnamed protein product [Tilletia controversa]|nr:unnamed protein product [Tilletia controversa]
MSTALLDRASVTVTAAENRPRGASSAAFAERFKYILCTSFLLTSSLSISFYSETHANNHIDHLEDDDQNDLLGSLQQQQRPLSSSSSLYPATAISAVLPFVRVASERLHAERLRFLAEDADDISVSLPKTTVRSPAESFDTPSNAIQVILPPHLHQQRDFSSSAKSVESPYTKIFPPLSPEGLILRNTTVASLLLLFPISSSSAVWFRSGLVLVSLAWATVLVFGWHVGSASSYLSIQLDYPPSDIRKGIMDNSQHIQSQSKAVEATANSTGAIGPPASAATVLPRLDMLLPPPISAVGQLVIRRDAFHSALRLVRAAQRLDIELNRAIAAIQEVELVRRGYKLTYPLAPISRIENMPSACPLHPSGLQGNALSMTQNGSLGQETALLRRISSDTNGSVAAGAQRTTATTSGSSAVDRRISTVSSSTNASSSSPTSLLSRDSQFSPGRRGSGQGFHRGFGGAVRTGGATHENLMSPHTSLSSQAEELEVLAARDQQNAAKYDHDQLDAKTLMDWGRSGSQARSSIAEGQAEPNQSLLRRMGSYDQAFNSNAAPSGAWSRTETGAACTCHSRQLLVLRHTLVEVLKSVGNEAGVVSARLNPLVDEMELGLLLGMEGGSDKDSNSGAAEIPAGTVPNSGQSTIDYESASVVDGGMEPILDDGPPVDIAPGPGQVSLKEELLIPNSGRPGSSARAFGSTSTSSEDESSPSGGSGANSLQRASEMAERRRARRVGLRTAAPPSSFYNHAGGSAASTATPSAPPVSYNPLNSAPASGSTTPDQHYRSKSGRPGTAESEPGFSVSGSAPANSRHVRRGSRLRYISDRPGSAMDQYSASPANTMAGQRPGSRSESPLLGSTAGARFSYLSNHSGGLNGHAGYGAAGSEEAYGGYSPAAITSAWAMASSSTSTAAAATRAVKRNSLSASSVGSTAGRNLLAQLRDPLNGTETTGSGAGLAPGARLRPR